MTELPRATGLILGNTVEDIIGTTWLLGHDLKSPIATIISTLEMVISLHEDDQELAQTIHLLHGALAAAKREYNMLGDVLDLARFELNQYELDQSPADIGVLLRESIEEESYSLKAKNIQYTVEIKDATRLIADIDIELFRRVFSTLIDNIIKFTVREDSLTVTVERQKDMIIIVFEDSGRPFLPGFEEHIMERAPQWEKRQGGSRTSIGMGLPFTYAVLKAHGGQFTVTSDPNLAKTRMTLTIPASALNR
jgi:two-component system sensor histidine kinase KdpD